MKRTSTIATQTVEDEYGRYECDTFGDWIGWAGAQRTLLKATLTSAKGDVQAERFVCQCWPTCRHKGPK